MDAIQIPVNAECRRYIQRQFTTGIEALGILYAASTPERTIMARLYLAIEDKEADEGERTTSWPDVLDAIYGHPEDRRPDAAPRGIGIAVLASVVMVLVGVAIYRLVNL